MIERHVTFDVLPDRSAEFERFFVETYRPGMASMPGFVRVELMRDQTNRGQYLMTIRFESLETAAGWRDSEVHQALKPRLSALHQGSSLRVYDVVAQDG